MNGNHLWRTKTYLVGKMHGEDTGWREMITPRLEKMGVIVINPLEKPFVRDVQESQDARNELLKKRESEDFDYLEKKMREIRSYDLACVDKSDFICSHLDPHEASWGSGEELVTAVRMKKPIFLSIKGGKKRTPLWIFGMLPHRYIYDSPEQIADTLEKINSGKIEMDSMRWKLFKKEYR